MKILLRYLSPSIFFTLFIAATLQSCSTPSSVRYQSTPGRAPASSCLDPLIGQPFSLGSFDPDPRAIDGVNFPRAGYVLHRSVRSGSSRELNPIKAIRAFFGDRSAYFSGYAHFALQAALVDPSRISASELSVIREYLAYEKLSDDFTRFQNCVLSLSSEAKEAAAARLSAELIDRSFRGHDKNGEIKVRYLDTLNQSNNVDWKRMGKAENVVAPLGATELLYTSIDFERTARYGNETYSVTDLKHRASDNNFFVKSIHGWDYSIHPNDVDEFILPGYASPNEFVGYVNRDNGWAVVKLTLEGRVVGLVIPSANYAGLLDSVYHLKDPKFLDRVEVIHGVIVSCPADVAAAGTEVKNCEVPTALSKFQQTTRISGSEDIMEQIKASQIDGQKLQWLIKRAADKPWEAR